MGRRERVVGDNSNNGEGGIPTGAKGDIQESRREWILSMFKKAAANSSNVTSYQFWQHHNKPIELWSAHVIQQKADYIQNNPVAAGFVDKPWYWKYSSAIDYADGKGLVDIDFL